MSQPILLEISPRDLQRELDVRVQRAPQQHAEAVLAGYEVLQGLHDRGVLEILRGTLGGGEKILEQAVAVAKGPDTIRGIGNVFLLVQALGEMEPTLLSDLTRAVPKALTQANKDEARPPGLLKLIGTFWNPDFRRGLAAFNDLLVGFGKNLTGREKQL
jgi:uncharacterized protein YjgD (DUF1641 family)